MSIKIIHPSSKDLGGFNVYRLLPSARQTLVGPFIFFDHFGPKDFAIGEGVDVRPHPHINLATVTYLFEGKLRHRDNLNSNQIIEPGAINWMIAGSGIVHSERTPVEIRKNPHRINGIQCWVALPEEQEDITPSFTHHPSETLRSFFVGDVQLKILLGEAFNYKSPVVILSKLFLIEANFRKNSTLLFKDNQQEMGVYVVDGSVTLSEKESLKRITIDKHEMGICHPAYPVMIEATEKSHVLLLGGESLGQRYIEWNFVSSSKAKINKAKIEWAEGPSNTNTRFKKIPGDDIEFIPLPKDTK